MSPRGHAPKGRYTSFESVLHELTQERISMLIAEIGAQLGDGSARKATAGETTAAYHEEIGRIRGLREAQNICNEVATDLRREG